MRETFFLILFIILIAIAAFEGGYIVRDLEKDRTAEKIQTLFSRQYDLSGRLVVVEGPRKDIKKLKIEDRGLRIEK